MLESFVTLFAANLFGDFLLKSWIALTHTFLGQVGRITKSKQKITDLIIRPGILALISGLLLGSMNLALLVIIFSAYFLVKLPTAFQCDESESSVPEFLLEATVLLTLSAASTGVVSTGWWAQVVPNDLQGYRFATLAFLCGTLLNIPVGATIIGRLMRPFTDQINDVVDAHSGELHKGLVNGGRFIGCSERALVMMLVLLSQWEGIGFLLAAKSILRFGEQKDRMFSEYVLIGTFLSFGWAMLVALLTQTAMTFWLP